MNHNVSNLSCALCGRVLTSATYTNTQGSNKNLFMPYGISLGSKTSRTITVDVLSCPFGHKYYLAKVEREYFNYHIEYSKIFLDKIARQEGKTKSERIINTLEKNIVSIYTVNYGLTERLRQFALDNIKMIIVVKFEGSFYDFYLAVTRKGNSIYNWKHIVVDYDEKGDRYA